MIFTVKPGNYILFSSKLVPEPVVEEPDCRIDIDCPSLEMCYISGGKNRCVDPCSTISPCVEHATCKVHSTTPTRTMSCTCFEGYTGNGVVSCDKISKQIRIPEKLGIINLHFVVFLVAPIEVGCSSDNECASSQACRNRACVNPCSVDNPCGTSAECTVDNHRVNCKCPPGLTGDPYSRCVPSKLNSI